MGYRVPLPPPRNQAEHDQWVKIMLGRMGSNQRAMGFMLAAGLILAVLFAAMIFAQ